MVAFGPGEKSNSDIAPVAVLLMRHARHVGILHVRSDLNPVFLHLAGHNALKSEPMPDNFDFLVELNVPIERAVNVAAFCRLIWARNRQGQVPYGMTTFEGYFRADATAVGDPGHVGLTCATFILAAFKAFGVHLINAETWPKRESDGPWRLNIIYLLEEGAITGGVPSKEHLEAVRNSNMDFRIKPVEVAAAAGIAQPPADFSAIREQVEILLSRFKIPEPF